MQNYKRTIQKQKKQYDPKLKDLKYDSAIEITFENAVHSDLIISKVDRTKLMLNEDGSVTGLKEQKKKGLHI